MSKKNLFFNISYLLSSNIVTQGLRIARGFIVAKFLGPELMGIWAALFIYLLYGENLHLGIYNSLTRDIPIFRGQHKDAMINRYFDNAFSFTVVSSILAFILLFIVGVFSVSSFPLMDKGMKFMPFLIFTQQWIVFFKFSFLSRNRMKQFSQYQAVYSIIRFLSAFLIIPFAFMGQLYGLLIVDVLYLLILIVFCADRYQLRRDTIWIKMLKSGFPIYLVSLIFVVLMSLNRIIIVKMLGPTALGHFSLAFLAFSFLYFIPESIRTVLYIRMGESYGYSGEDRKKLEKYLLVGTSLLSIIMPLVIFIMSIGIMFCVPMILPKYAIGIIPTILYIFAAFFLSLSVIYANYLNIIRKQVVFLTAQFITIVLHILGAIVLINRGYGLSGVSLACIFAYFIYFLLMHTSSLLLMGHDLRKIVVLFVRLLRPFLFFLCLCIVLFLFTQENILSFSMKNLFLVFSMFFIYMIFAFCSCYFDYDIRELLNIRKYLTLIKYKMLRMLIFKKENKL